MSYNANIPQPNDLLSKSQADIKNNFLSANTSFGVNHTAFDVAVNAGKHKFVEMPIQALPGTLANEGSLYTNTAGQSQLFYTADAGARAYQLTRAIDASFATFSTSTNYPAARTGQNGGWTFLPGGLLLQYGLYSNSSGGGGDFVKYPIPFTSTPFSVTLTMIRNSSNTDALYVHTVTNTQFGYRDTSSGNPFYWVAIGK